MCQVYLVTGGYTGSNRLVSTEILTSDEKSWRQVGDLPTVPIDRLRGVSFNNNIIMTGNNSVVFSREATLELVLSSQGVFMLNLGCAVVMFKKVWLC